MTIHKLIEPFVIDCVASYRYETPTRTETRQSDTNPSRYGYCRVIGGDGGDLLFDGYRIEKGSTILENPAIYIAGDLCNWSEDDFEMLAHRIFDESFNSIGIKTIYGN